MPNFLFRLFAGAALLGPASFAVETKTWTHDTQADFEKATLNKLSLRSDGRLFLAPVFQEILDASTAYLWALAEDSKGNVYAGGGGPDASRARLFQIDASGGNKTVAELEGLEIHAIAIDKKDRVYAATSPDGKVYRITGPEPEVFYDPKAKYIWAMAFNSAGELFVATGDEGEVHRVAPDGKGAVFFKSDETHVRSLAIDASGNLIAGTEPGGLVIRVSSSGSGFVLYQAPKKEVTAVAVAKDGSIYAAAVGNKQPVTPLAPPRPATPTPVPAPIPGQPAPTANPAAARATPPAPPPMTVQGPTVTGGSEVYRIDPDGFPRKIWSHAQDIVYAIALDAEGRAVIGTGNNGNIYRLDSELLSTRLINAPPTQVTGLHAGRQGTLYAVTGNVGKAYRIGPGLETHGFLESEPLDASFFSYWGQIRYTGRLWGGAVRLETRSGNLDRPQNNWSSWEEVSLSSTNGRIASPAARFVQYRLTLNSGSVGRSPEITSLEIPYMPKNIAPIIEEVHPTPPNYRFPPQALTLTPSQNLTLPPLGRARRTSTPTPAIDSGSVSMQYAKGQIGARWLARDDNGDALSYTVEIRGERETAWKLLKDKLKDRHLSWDSTMFPDGEYRLRVTASDSPSNPPQQALTGVLESQPFRIDNTPPAITKLSGLRTGSRIELSWSAADALSIIQKAEYSVNGGDWLVVEPVTRLSDSPSLDYRLTVNPAPAGETTVAVRVTDDFDNQSVEKVVVQ